MVVQIKKQIGRLLLGEFNLGVKEDGEVHPLPRLVLLGWLKTFASPALEVG